MKLLDKFILIHEEHDVYKCSDDLDSIQVAVSLCD